MPERLTRVKLDEASRRLVLMGLALLSLDHPDWQDACHRVALAMGEGAGPLYEELRRFRREFREPPENAREPGVQASAPTEPSE